MLDVLAKPAAHPLHRQRRPHPYRKSVGAQARRANVAIICVRCATLARFATVGVSMARGGHLPRWTTDVDRKRDDRFFNWCCMYVCTLS